MMKEYNSYIFDLYGTLVDILTDEEDPLFWEAFKDVLSNEGVHYRADELKETYLRLCALETERMQKETGINEVEIDLTEIFRALLHSADEKTVLKVAVAFRKLSCKKLRVYDGVYDLLNTLREKGKKVFLLSNAQECFTVGELEECQLTEYFDAIYISSLAHVRKPYPGFLMKLLEEQKADAADCVFIGNDIRSDMMSADAFAMDSIYLNTFHYSMEKTEGMLKKLHHPENVRLIMDGDIHHMMREE